MGTVDYQGEVAIYDPISNKRATIDSTGALKSSSAVASIPVHSIKLVTSTTGLKIEDLSASIIEHEHRKIHDGQMFLWERRVTATTAGAVKRYMIVVPNHTDGKINHAGISFVTNGQTTIRMRKGVTMTNTTLWASTSAAPLNMNHVSSVTSGIRVIGPMKPTLAVTQSGTLIGEAVYGSSGLGNKGVPGENAKYGEFILANNSKYLITIHPEVANLAATLAVSHYFE